MTVKASKALAVGRAHTDRTAPFSVPVLFWVAGTVSILTGFWRLWAVRDLLLAGDIGQGPVIAAVHLFTLGGLTMLMMGALYQLTPVLLNCDPVPAKRSVMQWGIYTAGVAFFVTGLNGTVPAALWIGGSGIMVGLAFFLVNMFQRFRQRQTWNITAWFFAASLFYLGLTAVMGALLVLRYITGWPSFADELPIHLAIALGGWFGLLVAGASYRLWAMFGRKHREPRYWRGTWTLANFSVLGLVFGDIGGWRWVTALGWVSQLVAFVLYSADIAEGGLFDHRTMKDPALRVLGPSIGFLAVWEILGSIALFGHYGGWWIPALFAYVLGWVGMTFLGFVQKILPFMVWLHRYAHTHGHGKMPRLDDIWRPSWAYGPLFGAASGVALLIIGWGVKSPALFTAGIALQMAAWLLLLAAGVKAMQGPHRLPE